MEIILAIMFNSSIQLIILSMTLILKQFSSGIHLNILSME